MSNILYITPHLSTGGLPRYLVMQVLASQKRGDEVWVVEWSNIAPVFRVQKDVLREELGEKLIEWPQGTGDSVKYVGLVGLVKEGNFDTIHMAEFPEGFLPDESIDFIYANSRAYKVYETTHDSAFRLEDKKTKPDKFVFVSDYHAALFAEYGVDIDIIPYVVESKERPDRSAALEKLGLDPLKKHVLNVGLFTPGKNQGEMVKIACALWGESVQFHFVGNQAGNFKDYWEPLNKTLTSNCTLWGERSDVGTFYECMDLLLFTSKSELMPLVPIEALSHSMPVLMYQDSIYGGRFDGLVEWLGSSVEENSQKVLEILELSKKLNIKLIHLLTRIEDKREQASVKSLERVQDYGIDYIQYINKPEEVYPQDIPALQIHREKKPGYYGAYKAFRDGIETSFDKDTDLLIVCECDCILGVEPGELAALLWRLSRVDFDYLSLGQTEWSTRLGDITEECFLTDKIILAHCVVFPQKSRDFILSQYSTLAWDSPDLWLDYAFTGKRKVVLEKPVAFQHSGFSLIDKEEKSGEYRIAVEEIEKEKEIEGSFNFEDIYSYIVNTLDYGHIVEIGAWFGKSTAFLAKLVKNSGKDIRLDVVDTWKGSDEVCQNKTLKECNVFEEFKKNMHDRKVWDTINAMRMTSLEACEIYEDNSLDFVFIDANHSFESVSEDISNWIDKVKPGGMIAGHDYIDGFPGVKEAVKSIFADSFNVTGWSWYHVKDGDNSESIDFTPKELIKEKVICNYSFIDGPKVDIRTDSDKEFDVEFIDEDSNKVIYKDRLKANHWASVNRKYFVNWAINVSYNGTIVNSFTLDLKGKKVLISFGSKALGDTVSWFPYVEEFAQKHSCKVVVSTFWNNLFEKEYPGIEFISPGDSVTEVYAVYNLGCYDEDMLAKNKRDWREIPMQQIATDILGLEYVEKRPRISIPDLPRTQKRDYVSVSEYSTMLCKYWNLAGGWKSLVDKIKESGLQVMSVSKEKTTLKKARRCNGKSIDETIRNIYYSKAFIGVSSGLVWLAWAMNVPVVLVSGFTKEFCEFGESEKVSRVINENVCNGCFNDVEYYFDRGDWKWCPREEDFICTKEISVEDIFDGLQKVLGTG